MVFQTLTSATDQQLIGSQSDFKLLTEWAESTAREKLGQNREETASDLAMQVNSSSRESLLFQRGLAERPLPERQLQPMVVGGRGGFELSVLDGPKLGSVGRTARVSADEALPLVN